MEKRKLILFIILGSFALIPGILYALAASDSTTNSSVPSTQAGNTLSSNATAFIARVDSGNRTMAYQKEANADLTINIEVSNPAKFVGTVTDPNGKIHPMILLSQGQGKMKLSYNATISDPIGNYITKIQLVRGSSTSNLSTHVLATYHTNPDDFRPATHQPK